MDGKRKMEWSPNVDFVDERPQKNQAKIKKKRGASTMSMTSGPMHAMGSMAMANNVNIDKNIARTSDSPDCVSESLHKSTALRMRLDNVFEGLIGNESGKKKRKIYEQCLKENVAVANDNDKSVDHMPMAMPMDDEEASDSWSGDRLGVKNERGKQKRKTEQWDMKENVAVAKSVVPMDEASGSGDRQGEKNGGELNFVESGGGVKKEKNGNGKEKKKTVTAKLSKRKTGIDGDSMKRGQRGGDGYGGIGGGGKGCGGTGSGSVAVGLIVLDKGTSIK